MLPFRILNQLEQMLETNGTQSLHRAFRKLQLATDMAFLCSHHIDADLANYPAEFDAWFLGSCGIRTW